MAVGIVLAQAGVFDHLLGRGILAAGERADGMPGVESVWASKSFLLIEDEDGVTVHLAPDATDEDARRVWCQAFVPVGVTEPDGSVERGEWSWPRPVDCQNPDDVPSPRLADRRGSLTRNRVWPCDGRSSRHRDLPRSARQRSGDPERIAWTATVAMCPAVQALGIIDPAHIPWSRRANPPYDSDAA